MQYAYKIGGNAVKDIEVKDEEYTIYFKVIDKHGFDKGKVLSTLRELKKDKTLEQPDKNETIFGVFAKKVDTKNPRNLSLADALSNTADYMHQVEEKLKTIGKRLKKLDDALSYEKLNIIYKQAMNEYQDDLFPERK